ncbi:MAG: hypothetical protein ABI172_13365, partial [Ginsengibacter sp.]
MKHSTISLYALAILLLTAGVSCKKGSGVMNAAPDPVIIDTTPTDLTTLKFTVEAAEDWTKLFIRTSGWFGGDGIFSIPQSGVDSIGAGINDKTLLLFSDSEIGEIRNGVLSAGWSMINNSVAVVEGNEPLPDKIIFYWNRDSNNKPASVFIPKS